MTRTAPNNTHGPLTAVGPTHHSMATTEGEEQ